MRLFILMILIPVWLIKAEEKEQTLSILRENSSIILLVTKEFGISPRLLISAIYADRRMYYNLLDTYMDVAIAKRGRDNSIGLCQIRVSTALCISKTIHNKNNPYYLGDNFNQRIPLITERDSIINILSDPIQNVYFAAAYSAMILKRWQKAGIEISDRVEIFATLYNLGPYDKKGRERKPHKNPQANEYGYVAKDFYDSELLLDIFPRY